MASPEGHSLWSVDDFDRLQREGHDALQRDGRPTLLPTTLQAELRRLHASAETDDVLEVMAACLRHREAALLYLQYEHLVWPVSLFPLHMLAHSPADLVAEGSAAGMAGLKLLSIEPPNVRPPGHWMHERVADVTDYRPLAPLLWAVALRGPRSSLLAEIGGRAAYRLLPARSSQRPPVSGALGPAIERLQREAVPLKEIAKWPGLSTERASRLLNALYLNGGLMVVRSNVASPDETSMLRRLFGRKP